jgi:hypothetical protein
MADEAFALSPISARASLPSEEDYDAISQAFMETSRGRWFLGEYARRNRNADTRMVLDAVARIEENLAAQRQPPPDNGLKEALAAIRNAVDEARTAAAAALDGVRAEQSLAPARKGIRVIREIAWRLREIGSDGRICDLIDSQIAAIEAGCDAIVAADSKAAVDAAFDLIEARIDGDAASPQAAEEAIATASPTSDKVAADEVSAEDATAGAAETMQAETTVATEDVLEPGAIDADAADAHDEAVLDLIALEMGAPDDFEGDDVPDIQADEVHAVELVVADPNILMENPEPAAVFAASPQTSPQLSRRPAAEPSLGSSLIASGIVARPRALASDPLAPIRRMSQAEKIAFFS